MEEAGNCHFADAITDACVNTKASCAVPVAARPNKPTSTTLIIASGERHACVSASHLGNRENTHPPLFSGHITFSCHACQGFSIILLWCPREGLRQKCVDDSKEGHAAPQAATNAMHN